MYDIIIYNKVKKENNIETIVNNTYIAHTIYSPQH